jgi:hypothetical protein
LFKLCIIFVKFTPLFLHEYYSIKVILFVIFLALILRISRSPHLEALVRLFLTLFRYFLQDFFLIFRLFNINLFLIYIMKKKKKIHIIS